MTKDELQKHHEFLVRTLSEFQAKEEFYLNGPNAKIRKRALSYLNIYVTRFKKYVTENAELYELLTGENETDSARKLALEEICSIQNFSRETARALKNIEGMLLIADRSKQ